MKAFFLADPHHRAGVRTKGGPLKRYLVHDRSAIDEPTNSAHIGPSQGWIVEDGGVFHPAIEQHFRQLIAGHTQRFSGAIEVETMACLILNLGKQNRFAL